MACPRCTCTGTLAAYTRDAEATSALFDRLKPTHVIHLAAFVGGLFRNLKYKVEFYRYNTLMNDAVMEACRLHGVCERLSAAAGGAGMPMPCGWSWGCGEVGGRQGRPPPGAMMACTRRPALAALLLPGQEARILPVHVHLP